MIIKTCVSWASAAVTTATMFCAVEIFLEAAEAEAATTAVVVEGEGLDIAGDVSPLDVLRGVAPAVDVPRTTKNGMDV